MANKEKARRDRLWAKNSSCRQCGVSTILPKDAARKLGITDLGKLNRKLPVEVRNRLATLEHLRDRHDPLRQMQEPNTLRTTLLCWKCNFDRGAASHLAQPIESRRQAASHLS